MEQFQQRKDLSFYLEVVSQLILEIATGDIRRAASAARIARTGRSGFAPRPVVLSTEQPTSTAPRPV